MKEKKRILLSVLIAIITLAALLAVTGSIRAQSGAPTLVSYQGQVTVDGAAYSGPGYFKFAVVNQAGNTSYWSNDGTSTGGGQPTNAVQLTVSDGLFNVLLGDTTLTHMTALPATAFDGTGRALRVWFSSDGSSFTLLSPDRRIVAAPYALQAEEARNADMVDGQHASAFAPAGSGWSLTGNAGTNPASSFLGTTDSQALVFRTNNTERMRLDTSGRLGLGTSSPANSPLTIRGIGANSEWIQFRDAADVNQWHLNYSSGGLNFAETGVADYRLFLEDGGDVGIGTDAPGAKLHVQQSSGYPTGYFENTGTGAYALRARTNSTTNGARTGYFLADGTSGNTRAIYARNNSDSNDAAAGEFFAAGTTGMMTGVWAEISGTHGSSTAAYFRNRSVSGAGFAGWFVGNTRMEGNLNVTGSVFKGGGGFKIDHPLDPANKTLSHSFVESPDMMNVYNGNVVLDENGEAWVQLPDWFEALNEDYRYQLTCIGGFAPVYIASEIEDNRFQIAGGLPGLKVSWQVTGIRHDPYADMYRIPVEEDKPAEERGTYRCPECYGLPEALDMSDARSADPDMNSTR
jgi:hypothetical protein